MSDPPEIQPTRLAEHPTARAVLLAVGLQPHFFQKKASPIVTL